MLDNSFIRVNADFIDEKKFILRLQNVHRLENQAINQDRIQKLFTKKVTLKMVDFDYLFSEDNQQRPLDDVINFLPLEFKTILGEFN